MALTVHLMPLSGRLPSPKTSHLKIILQHYDCKVTFILVKSLIWFYLLVPTRKHKYFYQRNNLKQVSGFLSPDDKAKLEQLAKDADKSMQRYVTRLLEKHIAEQWAKRSSEKPTILREE